MMDFFPSLQLLSTAEGAETSSTMTIAECIVYAVQHPLVGAIALLAAFSLVMTVLYVARVRKDRKIDRAETDSAPLPPAPTVTSEPQKDDAALIAAITAAVAVYLDLEAAEKGTVPPAAFHIVSYQRKR